MDDPGSSTIGRSIDEVTVRIIIQDMIASVHTSICGAALIMATNSFATVITFENLNTDLTTGNSLTAIGGDNSGLSVTGVNNGNSGISYSVTYTDDFGGSIGNQTVSFVARVTGVSDSVVTFGNSNATNSSAVIGSTATDITILNDRGVTWRPTSGAGGGNRFDPGDTLIFDILNPTVTGGFSLNVLGFTNALIDESTGINHRIVVGDGMGLYGHQFGGNLNIGNQSGFQSTNPPIQQLIISAAASSGSNNINFGVQDVDFQLEIVPEPSSMGLLGLGSIALMLLRRRR